LKEMEIRVERLEALSALYTCAFSDTPEEDAPKESMKLTKASRLIERFSGTRLFGRNIYPTDKPEPHGFELYLTIHEEIKPERDPKMKDCPADYTLFSDLKTCPK
jgi:hypothetical protein